MSDLRERFQELADVAARQGRPPGPQAALRRMRRRRRQRATWTAALLAMVLLAVTVGVDRLAGPAPLAPTATTTASTTPPDVSITPDPGKVERPAGSPPGRAGEQMVRDVATAVAECRGGPPDPPTVLVAWGRGHDQTWLVAAAPPHPGEKGLCWANGLFQASGAGGYGKEGGPGTALKPLRASGSQNLRSGGRYWGQIIGHVTKRATRVQVLFRGGIAPLELTPIQSGDRFPVNFYVGFYRQPKKDRNLEWFVTRVIAYDSAGNRVAECQATAGPGHSC